MTRVYVSSTYEDLAPYRDTVLAALQRLPAMEVVAPDLFGAEGSRLRSASFERVRSCDVFIGIIGWRYGFVPPENNRDGKSIPELEYSEAGAFGKTRLMFALDPNAPSLTRNIDASEEGGRRIDRFRDRIARETGYTTFRTPDELASLVTAAVFKATTQDRPAAKSEPSKSPRIFISHATRVGAQPDERIRRLESRLLEHGMSVVLQDPALSWGNETDIARMRTHVADADHVLLICTAAYYQRAQAGDDWWRVIQQELMATRVPRKFIPVIFHTNDAAFIPISLRAIYYARLDDEDAYQTFILELLQYRPEPAQQTAATGRPDAGESFSPSVIKDLELMASDTARLAVLLARMALNDRTRLDLAAAPSLSGFREALAQRKVAGGTLPALETRMAAETASFMPNSLWLSWVQTVHRRGLDAIQAEIRSWLPGGAAGTATVAEAPADTTIGDADRESRKSRSRKKSPKK